MSRRTFESLVVTVICVAFVVAVGLAYLAVVVRIE